MEPDELLAKALSSYTAGEPSSQLPKRVRARIRNRRRWFWAGVPVAAAACLIAVISFRKPVGPVIKEQAAPVQIAHIAVEDAPAVAMSPRILRVRYKLKPPKPPKRPNAQELALMELMAHSPDTVLAALASLQQRLEMPLAVREIDIAPIAIQEMNQ